MGEALGALVFGGPEVRATQDTRGKSWSEWNSSDRCVEAVLMDRKQQENLI